MADEHERRTTLGAGACLFATGLAALVYEITWLRQASLVFGSGMHATGTVLGVFFAGLALGSELAGRLAARLSLPLVMFAALEAALAAWALPSPLAFAAAERALVALHGALPDSPLMLVGGRVLLVAAIVLPPAVLMGAALPLVCRQLVRRDGTVGAPVAWLYALNTLGAATGCWLAGFVLLPRLGVSGAIASAAALDLLAALAAWGIARRLPPLVVASASAEPTTGRRSPTLSGSAPEVADAPPSIAGGSPPAPRVTPAVARSTVTAAPAAAAATPVTLRAAPSIGRGAPAAAPAVSPTPGARLPVLAAACFLVGAIALGHEVLWARLLSLVLRNSLHTWTLTLGAVLLGIVAGSLAILPRIDRSPRRALLLGFLPIAGSLLAFAILRLPVETWRALATRALLLLALPAALWGACLPLAVRAATDRADGASRALGRLTAANGAGGIVGSLLVGFVLLPRLGLAASLHVLTACGLLAGALAWFGLPPAGWWRARSLALALAVAAWAALSFALDTRLPHDHLVDPGETLVAVEEGLAGNLAVLRRDGVTALEIDRWWQGEDRQNHQSLAAAVPLLLHGAPASVLVVGVGTGQTPRVALGLGAQRLDAVDVEPAVFDVLRAHFDGAWLDDPRVRTVPDDGRHHVLVGGAEYDVIALELGQVFLPGVAACYTQEFYARAADRLRPGGVLCQFVPAAFLEPELFRRVVASFRAAFPRCLLWYNTSELLLLGTTAERWQLDRGRLEALGGDATLRAALDFSHWGGAEHHLHEPTTFLAGLLAGPDELAALAGNSPPLVDDRPELELAAAAVPDDAELERPLVALLSRHLCDVGAALGLELLPEERERIERVRALDLGDMLAAAVLRRAAPLLARGDQPALLAVAEEALAANPESWQARRLRGETLLALGRPEQALPDLEAAVAQRPDDGTGQRALGFALHRLGRAADAIPHYRAALLTEPDNAELHNNLGAALAELGRLDEARDHFLQATRLRPDDVGARQNLERLEAQKAAR